MTGLKNVKATGAKKKILSAASFLCAAAVIIAPLWIAGVIADFSVREPFFFSTDAMELLPGPLSDIMPSVMRNAVLLASSVLWPFVSAAAAGAAMFAFLKARNAEDARDVGRQAGIFFSFVAIVWANLILLLLSLVQIHAMV